MRERYCVRGQHQAFDRDYRDVSGEDVNRQINVRDSISHHYSMHTAPEAAKIMA